LTMEPIMLLNRITMFLLMIMVFLTGFLHCLRLDTPSFLSLINHILSDSDNSNNNNSGSSDDSNNYNSGSNNSGSSDDSNNYNSGSNNSGSNNSGSNNSGGNNSGGSGNTFTPAIGVLDTSFNSPNGSIIQPIGSSLDYGYSLAIQPDGKILLGGYCYYGSNYDFCIARFKSDGTLDTTFNSPNGYIIQPIGSWVDEGFSLAIQPDGKILLGGHCDNDFCIARFNSDGTLDNSFGSPYGYIIQPISTWVDDGYSLAIQPDGKILLGGSCSNGSNYDFCIARFNPMALSIQLLILLMVIKYNPSVQLMIMDNLLQSNPMEKSYSVVIALTEAITISALLVLILMALSIQLLEVVVK
jgi:uncharacterized delta-60 repeat protein